MRLSQRLAKWRTDTAERRRYEATATAINSSIGAILMRTFLNIAGIVLGAVIVSGLAVLIPWIRRSK